MKNEEMETTSVLPIRSRLVSNRVEKTRLANQRWAKLRENSAKNQISGSSWKRETKRLPRNEAREFARSFLKKFPKAAYWTEVESWRMLEGDIIEFTMRRLPSAD